MLKMFVGGMLLGGLIWNVIWSIRGDELTVSYLIFDVVMCLLYMILVHRAPQQSKG